MATSPNPTITNLESGGQYINAPIYDEQGQNALNNLLQTGGSRLANPTQGFDPYEQYANRLFQTQVVPNIANRFSGQNLRSSAFAQQLGQAGADLSAQLGVARANYGMQNTDQALRMLNLGLTPQYNQAYERPYSAQGQIGANLLEAAPKWLAEFKDAQGNTALEKFNNMLLGSPGKAATGGTASDVVSAAKTGVDAIAAGKAATDVAKDAVKPVPKALAAGTDVAKAAGAAGGAGAVAGKAATVGGFKAAEAAIAPALAAAGAVAMPLAVAGLFGWWLYKLIND